MTLVTMGCSSQFLEEEAKNFHLSTVIKIMHLSRRLTWARNIKQLLILDPKPQWNAHIKHLVEMMTTQKTRLARLQNRYASEEFPIPMIQADSIPCGICPPYFPLFLGSIISFCYPKST
jgi:hypothetical protein